MDSQSEPVMTDKDLVMALTEIVSSSNSKLENLTVKACWFPVFKKILCIQNVTLTESLAQRNEAFAHKKLAAQVLSDRVKELENQLSQFQRDEEGEIFSS